MDRVDFVEKKIDEVQNPLKPMQEPGRSFQPIDDLNTTPTAMSHWTTYYNIV